MKLILVLVVIIFATLGCHGRRQGGRRPGGPRPDGGRPGGPRPDGGRPGRPRPDDGDSKETGDSTDATTVKTYDGDCYLKVSEDMDPEEFQVVLRFNRPIDSLSLGGFTIKESSRNKKFVLTNSESISAGSVELQYTAEYNGRRRLRGRCGCNRRPETTESPTTTTETPDGPPPPA
ncbi:uncharacterized protein LOC127733397 [Mytilus californianus]|uniref:uncharacterized protein LOC127733397 n=1 Tax=Mytilus californianus TaxID=6549 RepID=UPI002246ED10|nr:uncharacterized protein LOC127733397 [Mytilus californianus]